MERVYTPNEVAQLCIKAMNQGAINNTPAQSTMSDKVDPLKWLKENLNVTRVIEGQCNCECHQPGVKIMHMFACCDPYYVFKEIK